MPDKLLKDGLRTSAKIGAVAEFAELLFVRLILATCHAGRCPWNPGWIRSHALPNRPRKRLTEIAAALESLRRARLVTRYTGHDGTAYLLIPNHGQRLRHAVRSPWPAPPEGPPDADGQTFMGFSEDPPDRKKPKALGGGAPAFSSPPSSGFEKRKKETEADWLARLAREWPDVDVRAELREAQRKKPRGVERRWFEEHWLSGCSPKVGAGSAVVGSPSSVLCPPEPPGWRQRLEAEFPGNAVNRDGESWPNFWRRHPDLASRVLAAAA